MTNKQDLQDKILQGFCQEETPVFVYLTNGIRLQGQIHSFDNYALFLKGGSNQMVYKHAIATVMPGSHAPQQGQSSHHHAEHEHSG